MSYLSKEGLIRYTSKLKEYLSKEIANAVSANSTPPLPAGTIVIWSGAQNAIPSGWALCNGQNGTPDLRNRFVVGAGHSYSVGLTGGEETHTLTINEMPSHGHDVKVNYSEAMNSVDYRFLDLKGFSPDTWNMWNNTNTGTPQIQSTGGGQAHNNMPPYYALCYIMKTA